MDADRKATPSLADQADRATSVPRHWTREADVVVVGYGLAGASAALAASEAGAQVLLLEKMPQGQEGGNSRVSGNMVWPPPTAADARAYFAAMAAGHLADVPDELIGVWAREMVANRAWIEGRGIKLVPLPPQLGLSPELPHLPGSQGMIPHLVNGTMGNAALWDPVSREVAQQQIEVLYATPARRLVPAPAGVCGVIAESEGREIAVKARRAVILTCGGYEFNETMKANYLVAPCYGLGSPANTGDGILMAMELGAGLWHMNNPMGPINPAFLTPDLGPALANIPIMLSASGKSFMWVDRYGRRFMNEMAAHMHGHNWQAINYYDGTRSEYPRIPWWLVFDETVRQAGPLQLPIKATWFGWHSNYQWSKDNGSEIARGWILQADTIAGLAAGMGCDSAVLSATLQQFDACAEARADVAHGRPAATMAAIKAPYYAIRCWPALANTQGGPRRNARAQVVNVWGQPIPRLYSAGECGSVYAWLYQAGGNLGECLAFGRLAGRGAAAEEPWS